ncbi:MAG: acyl-CoA reductase [Candidatus Wallbacteria bacterium]|nr:acyl-CoA reductase [Candidatus Wallbacteria bacterium]
MPELIKNLRQRQKLLAGLSLEKIAGVLEKLSAHFAKKSVRKELLKKLPGITGFSVEMCEAGLQVLSEILSREMILARVNGEFGNLRLLDEFVRTGATGLLQKARPLGVILHIAPGNVFLGIADSIVMALITKNASLIKLSSRDTFFPRYFAAALKSVDEQGIVSSCLDFFESSHDSPELDRICREADGILFWGGAEAMSVYRDKAGLSTRLILNGPRFSLAVAEEACFTDEDYNLLGRDIVMWEQQACSSPQIIYLIGDENKFSRKLNQALAGVLNSFPPGKIPFDERVEIRRERERARIEALERGDAPLFQNRSPDFALIRLYEEGARISPNHRNVFLKKIRTPEDVLTEASDLRPFLQTIGIKISSLSRKLADKLLATGAMRIVPPGRMCEGVPGAPHDGRFLLHELIDFISFEQGTSEKLADILDFARKNSPYYGKIIKPKADLTRIPFLDRDIIRSISPPVSDEILTGPLTGGFYFCSGGTSGNPKYSFYSNDDFFESTEILADIYKQAGINQRDIVANTFIAGNLWTSFLVVNRALMNIGCLNLPIGGNTRTEEIAELVSRFSATAIVGLPSVIISVAEHFRKKKLKSSVRKVLYGGEHMSLEAAAFLRRQMGVTEVRSAGYAIVDSGPIGVQCRHLSGTLHHAISRYNLIEFIRDHKPVPDGETGEIIVTNLSRRLMPVIRFRTGDLGRKVQLDCPCGNRDFVFELLGRCDDTLTIGGMNLLLDDISRAVGKTAGFSPIFQLVARKDGHRERLIIRIERRPDCRMDLRKLEEKFLSILKSEAENIFFSISQGLLNIEIRILDPGAIERIARTGKIRRVIDERR